MSSNERNAPDQAYLDRLASVRIAPVFIMGDHRSGTTLLYQLLNRSGCFNPVTAYHILCYPELLANHVTGREDQARDGVAALFKDRGLTDRQIDGVQVTPDLPEEYGFLLHGSGARPRVSARNVARFLEICRKVQYVSDPKRPLLLKNPWDYFLNFMYIKAVVPQARFIFLSRHPARVINSQLNATRRLFSEENEYLSLIADWYAPLWGQPLRRQLTAMLFSERLQLGRRLTERHVVRGIDYLLRYLPTLPASDAMTIRYEDLCTAPNESMHSLLAFLKVPSDRAIDYTDFIETRPSPLLAEVAAAQPGLAQRLAAYYRQYDYSETADM